MKHSIIYILLSMVFFSSPSFADIYLSGHITSDDSKPLAAKIIANGLQFNSNEDGYYTVTIPEADIYQLVFFTNGYFPMVHTFSHYELSGTKTLSNEIIIPSISLVPKKEGRKLMVFGGDVMMGRRYGKPHAGEPILIREKHKPEDSKAILNHMKPYLEIADLASINLETQVFRAEPEKRAPKSVTFYSPPEVLSALKWAGIDYVTLGNNHTYDYLEGGLASTMRFLDDANLAFSGAGFSEREALNSRTINVDGTPYSFQGYVGWSGSGIISQAAEGDEKGGPALGSETNIMASVMRDVKRGDLPIVQYHGSLEYGDEPSLATETKMKAAIDNGAVMALVHHPHVFQGLEVYKNRLIAWSLGNFVFDQYFYAAQKSALLYVWMDRDRLHRAEVVPLYIKGYKPTPATGEMRHSILKRISDLSRRRGTVLTPSGGHAIVSVDKVNAERRRTIKLSYPELTNNGPAKVQKLNIDWDKAVSMIDNLALGTQYRLGTDLLNRGSFETYDTFDTPDRSWMDLDKNVSVIKGQSYSGKNSLKLHLSSTQKKVTTGMRKFTRVFKPGNPTTISAMVKSDGVVKLSFYSQRRGTRDKLFDALENNPRTLLRSIIVQPGEWRQINIAFDSPRVGTRSLRFLIEAESDKNTATDLFIDNLALIEWRTPLLDRVSQKSLDYLSPESVSHLEIINLFRNAK